MQGGSATSIRANERPILLVGDCLDDVLLTRLAFETAGFSPIVVCNPEHASRYLDREDPYTDRAQFPAPRLLVLDLDFPRMTGLNVLARLRLRPEWQRLPAVVLCTSRQDPAVHRAYELGAEAVLIKPAEFTELVATMKQIGDSWLRRRRGEQRRIAA